MPLELCSIRGREQRDEGHALAHDHGNDPHLVATPQGGAGLEEERVKGAIKTDFILSAEIMTIALAAIPPSNIWMEAATLAVVGIGITVVVYGSVALIVKADDLGLLMARQGRFRLTRNLGQGIVKAMPGVLKLLTVVGTAAMLWVGGSIVIHGLEELGFGWLGHHIHDWAEAVAHLVSPGVAASVKWLAKAVMDGIFGVALGLVLIPLASKVIAPVWQRLAAVFP